MGRDRAKLRVLQQSFVAVFGLALAVAPALGEVKVDKGGEVLDVDAGGGMSADNPRVRELLAAHPDQFVVICVAGCGGKPRVVQLLPRPVSGRIGEHVPSAAMGREVYGPPRPGQSLPAASTDGNEVVCVAGCVGRPGQVLQRVNDLAARAKAAPKARKEKRNEPLEVLP